MHLNFNDQTIAWALQKIMILRFKPGFPTDSIDSVADEQLRRLAVALLRIAHPAMVALQCNHVRLTDQAIEHALATAPEELERIELSRTQGKIKPFDYTVDFIYERFTFFPAIAEVRVQVLDVFPPADGITEVISGAAV